MSVLTQRESQTKTTHLLMALNGKRRTIDIVTERRCAAVNRQIETYTKAFSPFSLSQVLVNVLIEAANECFFLRPKGLKTYMKVGVAAVELRATDDMVIAGNIGPTKLSGQDGMLRAVATVIQAPPNDTRVAVVALDILAIGREYLDDAAMEIEQKTGIPFDHVLISCTHGHNSPSTVRIHGYDPVPEFVVQVKAAVIQSVVRANQDLASSEQTRMLFVMGREETVGQDSRFELRDGTVAWAWNSHPPEDRLRATGPFDPDFPVIAFKRSDRSLAAVIFGHSTHSFGTRRPARRSPTFYGLAAQTFEQETGAVTTFIEGAAGSTHLTEIDGLRGVDELTISKIAVEAERRILDALRYHVDQASEIPVARIDSLKREFIVKVRTFDEASEEYAVSSYCQRTFGVALGEKVAAVFRQMRAELASSRGKQRKTWISVMRVGDVAIVGVPAELFTQLGIDIKRRSPFRYTFIAELANDYVGYVANADAYRLGGYQIWTGLHSWAERGTGELMVDECSKLLNELYWR